MTKLPIKVFISSPGDVEQERVITSRIIKRLAERYADKVSLSGIFWEHEPLKATDTFQRQIVPPSQTDIAVCILWARLGTRLPKDITREDGSRYESGTEFEFEDAFLSQKKNGIPDLLVYRKTSEPLVSLTDEDELLQRIEQKRALDRFIDKWFVSDDGSLTAAFHPFDTGAQFEEIFEIHLSKLIEAKIEAAGLSNDIAETNVVERTWEGNPFRGLEVFEYEHAEIFFGRTRATEDILNQLRKQNQKGTPIITVLGMSGSGKSSIIRAGVVPLLTKPGVIEGVADWRRAYLKPSDMAGDLVSALCTSLCAETAIPELNESEEEYQALHDLLSEEPKAAATHIAKELKFIAKTSAQNEISKIKEMSQLSDDELSALEQKYRENPPKTQLVLVIDQLEELFTQSHLDDAKREYFVALLDALCRTRTIWIIATLRSDFYAQMSELKNFEELRKGDGQIDLYPPTSNEIYQMIRLPAQAAGLSFAENPETGERLDDCLRDAAARDEGSLPVLQFTLAELYKKRSTKGQLTFSAYDELGGLEGALASTAEDAFNSLSTRSQQSFNQVFRRLVNVSASGERVTKAPCLVSSLDEIEGASEFVAAFIERRLMISDQNDKNQPIVSVAHEALLRAWPRIQDWLENDRELLQIKARLEFSCQQWLAADQDSQLLLNDGKPLDEAKLLTNEKLPLTSAQRDFIRASEKKNRARQRLRQTAIAALMLLTVMASVAAYFATEQKQLAEQNQILAEQAKESAVSSEQLSQFRLSQVFTQQGLKANDELQTKRAALLFGAAWQHNKSATNEYLLANALEQLKAESLLKNIRRNGGGNIAFSPDQKYLIVTDQIGQIEIWSTQSKQLLTHFKGHHDLVTKIVFSRSGDRFYTASADNTINEYTIQGEKIRSFDRHFGAVFDIQLTQDGSRVFSIGYENNALLWNALSGELISRISFETASDIRAGKLSESGTNAYTISSEGMITNWSLQNAKAEIVEQCQLPEGFAAGEITVVPQLPGFANRTIDQQVRFYRFDCTQAFELSSIESTLKMPTLSENALLLLGEQATQLVAVDFTDTTRLALNNSRDPIARFSRDAELKTFVTANQQGDIHRYNFATQQLQSISQGSQTSLSALELSADGRFGAALDESGELRFFDWSIKQQQQQETDLSELVGFYSFAELAVAIAKDGSVIFKQNNKASVASDRLAMNAPVRDVVVDTQYQWVFILTDTLTIWDVQTGNIVKTIVPNDPSIAFSQVEVIDEEIFALAQVDGDPSVSNGKIEFYSLKDFALINQSDTWAESVWQMQTFLNGVYVIALAEDNLQLWNTRTAKRRLTIANDVSSFEVSPDKNKIAVGFADGRSRIMRHTAALLIEFKDEGRSAHQNRIVLMRWDPQQNLLLTADDTGQIKVWDAQSGLLQSNLTPSVDRLYRDIFDARFSDDGRYVVVLSKSGSVRLFDPRSGTQLNQIQLGTALAANYSAVKQQFEFVLQDGTTQQLALPQLNDDPSKLSQTIKQAIPWGFAKNKARPSDEWLELALLVLDESLADSDAEIRTAQYLQAINRTIKLINEKKYLTAQRTLNDYVKRYSTGLKSDGRLLAHHIQQQLAGFAQSFELHNERIEAGTYNPHMDLWLTSDWNRVVHGWNEQGLVFTLSNPWNLNSLVVHPRENWLLGSTSGHGVRMIDLVTKQERLHIESDVNTVYWSRDGETIVSTDSLHNVYRHDNQGKLLSHFSPPNGFDKNAQKSVSQNGKVIALYDSGNLYLYFVDKSEPIRLLADDLSDQANTKINDVLLSASGQRIWVALADHPVIQIDLDGAAIKSQQALNYQNADSLFLNRSETVIIFATDRAYRAYPLNQKDAVARYLSDGYVMEEDDYGRLTSDYVTLDNDTLGFTVFDTTSATVKAVSRANGEGFTRIAFHPEAEQALIFNGVGEAKLFDFAEMSFTQFASVVGGDKVHLSVRQNNSDNTVKALVSAASFNNGKMHLARWSAQADGWQYQGYEETSSATGVASQSSSQAADVSAEGAPEQQVTQVERGIPLAIFNNREGVIEVHPNGIVSFKTEAPNKLNKRWQQLDASWLKRLQEIYQQDVINSDEEYEQYYDEETETESESESAVNLPQFDALNGYDTTLIQKAYSSPSGEWLALQWIDFSISLVAYEQPFQDLTKALSIECETVNNLRWLSNDLLGIDCGNQQFSLYHLPSKRQVARINRHLENVVGAIYHVQSNQLVLADNSHNAILLINLTDDTSKDLVATVGLTTAITYDQDNTRYAIANDNGQVMLFASNKPDATEIHAVSDQRLANMNFFQSGQYLAALTASGELVVIDVASASELINFPIAKKSFLQFWHLESSGRLSAMSADGRLVYIDINLE